MPHPRLFVPVRFDAAPVQDWLARMQDVIDRIPQPDSRDNAIGRAWDALRSHDAFVFNAESLQPPEHGLMIVVSPGAELRAFEAYMKASTRCEGA